MPESNTPVLSAVLHSIHNLKQYRTGITTFPGEAIGILERFANAAVQAAAGTSIWPNGCDETAPKALRYLASKPRPSGGEDRYNSEHLLQIADELERAVKTSVAASIQPPAGAPTLESLLAQFTDAQLFDILTQAGRADKFDFRIPGTMRYEKVDCAVLAAEDVIRFRERLIKRAK